MTFRPGDRVRVRPFDGPGHVRTPTYVRGKAGWIERVHGDFRDPESMAYGGDGQPREPLYMVGFHQSDLWQERHRESERDNLYVDLYEHWLQPESET